LPQTGAKPLAQFLDYRGHRRIGISIAEWLFSILQNNPDGKAFIFI